MNKKIIWGIIIIFLGLFYMFQQHIPDSILRYIVNYQVLLMIIGVYHGIQKKTFGWVLAGVGLYLYLKEFFDEYFNLGFPSLLLVVGIGILAYGIMEKKQQVKKNNKKENVVYKSTYKNNDDVEIIEDAEEIK